MSTIPKMTSRQRVLAAFEGRRTDRVPVGHIGFSSRAASCVLGREAYVGGGIQQWREAAALWKGPAAHAEFLARSIDDAFELTRKTQQDLFRWEYWRMNAKPVAKRDEHTYVFGDPAGCWQARRYDPQTEMFPVVEEGGPKQQPIQNADDLERDVEQMERSEPAGEINESLRQTARQLLDRFPDYALRFHGGFVFIPHDQAVWLEAVLLRPDLVGRYLDSLLRSQMRRVRALIAAGVKLIFGGGDFASNSGPMYSPQAFHELVLPRYQKITAETRRAGVCFLYASDGNLWPVANDLFGASGIDGYYEIDRRAGMDLNRLRDTFPNLTLVGANISSHTVACGACQEITEEVRDCMETAKARGRIIVGISNYVAPETPQKNVMAMLEAIERYR